MNDSKNHTKNHFKRSPLDLNVWEEQWYEACENNEVGKLKELRALRVSYEAQKMKKNIGQDWMDVGLIVACEKGAFEAVKWLSSDPEIESAGYLLANPAAIDFAALQKVCQHGFLNILKFLLLDSNVRRINPLPLAINRGELAGFILACEYNRLDIVEFLTTSDELKKAGYDWVDLSLSVGKSGLRGACRYGHVEVVKFLTSGSKLKEKGRPYVSGDYALIAPGFLNACANGHWNVIRYFLEDPDFKAIGHAPIDLGVMGHRGFELACLNGHQSFIEQWLTWMNMKPSDPDFVQKIGGAYERGLQGACEEGHWDFVEWWILDQGGPIPADRTHWSLSAYGLEYLIKIKEVARDKATWTKEMRKIADQNDNGISGQEKERARLRL